MAQSPLAIRQITYEKIFIPFRHQVTWSGGTRPGSTRLVVFVETEGGTVGVGETICLHEFVEPVLVRTIIPLSLGEPVFALERLHRKIEGAGYYHHKRAMVMALAAVEMACWDALGKQAGLPLHQLWGGGYRQQIPVAAYIQSDDLDHVGDEAVAAVEAGYRTIKVKLGMGEQLDVAILQRVRAAVGPTVQLRGDANGAWTIGTAKRLLRRLEEFDLEYIEQPLPLEDLAGHAHLRQSCRVPIALDESAYTLQDVHAIVAAQAADVVLIDPHEAGGLLAARKLAAVCEGAGLPVTLHSGGETGIGAAAYLHLAATIPNLSLAIDLQYPNLARDVVDEPLILRRGMGETSPKPGLGVTVDRAQLAALRTDSIPNPYRNPDRPDWFTTKPAY